MNIFVEYVVLYDVGFDGVGDFVVVLYCVDDLEMMMLVVVLWSVGFGVFYCMFYVVYGECVVGE